LTVAHVSTFHVHIMPGRLVFATTSERPGLEYYPFYTFSSNAYHRGRWGCFSRREAGFIWCTASCWERGIFVRHVFSTLKHKLRSFYRLTDPSGDILWLKAKVESPRSLVLPPLKLPGLADVVDEAAACYDDGLRSPPCMIFSRS
jgi:hypothetical protein